MKQRDISLLRTLIDRDDLRSTIIQLVRQEEGDSAASLLSKALEYLSHGDYSQLIALDFNDLDALQALAIGMRSLHKHDDVDILSSFIHLALIATCGLHPYDWVESHASMVEWIRKDNKCTASLQYANDIIEWALNGISSETDTALWLQFLLQSALHKFHDCLGFDGMLGQLVQRCVCRGIFDDDDVSTMRKRALI